MMIDVGCCLEDYLLVVVVVVGGGGGYACYVFSRSFSID